MFEAAEVGNSLDKKTYKRLEAEVHERLLSLQFKLRESRHSLIVIVSGVEGAGKGEVVDCLNRWFDTRDVQTHAFFDETDEERQRPRFWRFWRTLPERGTISVMFGSWYTQPIVERAFDRIPESDFDAELQRIAETERMLAVDGTIIVKLWFHLSSDVQQKRLKKDSSSGFKKSPNLEEYAKRYPDFARTSERAIRLTDTGASPWHIIEATDPHYRDITAANVLIEALENHLDEGKVAPQIEEVTTSVLAESESSRTVLDNVDLTATLNDDEYDKRLKSAQRRLHELAWEMYNAGRNTVMVFEGWDAAGKGSSIRRLTQAIDARLYRVIPVAAPTDEELDHHYLWRFWRHLPRAGYMSIYDRSWYGRVLVERVEGFAARNEWLRSYREINDFEEQLVHHGVVVMKFWVHISAEEQLARFKAREGDARKQHKITDEDWRNREKWDDYRYAVNDMVAHTSTDGAPWTIVAGNDKKFGRIQILETVCNRLEQTVGGKEKSS